MDKTNWFNKDVEDVENILQTNINNGLTTE